MTKSTEDQSPKNRVIFPWEFIFIINQSFINYKTYESITSDEGCFRELVQKRGESFDLDFWDTFRKKILIYRNLQLEALYKEGPCLQFNFNSTKIILKILFFERIKSSQQARSSIHKIIKKTKLKQNNQRNNIPANHYKSPKINKIYPSSLIFFLKEKKILMLVISGIIFISLLLLTHGFAGNSKGTLGRYNLEVFKNTITLKRNKKNTLWKRQFQDFLIERADLEKFKEHLPLGKNLQDNKTSLMVRAILTKRDLKKYSSKLSISSDEWDNKIVFLNQNNKILQNLSFTDYFFTGFNFDFAKTFIISKYDNIKNKDLEERVYIIDQAYGMFPETFYYETSHGFNFRWINPGRLNHYEFINKENNKVICLFFGHNNLMAHSYYLAEITIPNKRGTYFGFPNFDDRGIEFINDFIIFLPKSLNITKNQWKKEGVIYFQDQSKELNIKVSRDYTLEILSGYNKGIYKDNKNNLGRIYFLINQSFQQKNINKTYKEALKTIEKCLKININNPFLKSIIHFFKGDLEVLNGNFPDAKESLHNALLFNPKNPDAQQRLYEISFLEKNPILVAEDIDQNYSHLPNFWGLSQGKRLFQFFCCLHAAQHLDADNYLAKILQSKPGLASTLNGIKNLFSGNYKKAEDEIAISFERKKRLLTLTELRLLKGRAMVLSNMNIEKAGFYFNDIRKHSITRSHLAEISSFYINSLNNQIPNQKIHDSAVSSFNNLLKLSRGDFETRFWLFYDAYIYAKTMELFKDSKEAIRGYQECIKANPHTDLARQAKVAIEKNKN